MEFEWDEEKEACNIAERGISFEYARRIFDDPEHETVEDIRRNYGESRYLTFGHISGRLHVVGHTPREEALTRIFSARKANKCEQRKFELWKKE